MTECNEVYVLSEKILEYQNTTTEFKMKEYFYRFNSELSITTGAIS